MPLSNRIDTQKDKAMDCQDINFDHHQHYLNTRRMARQRAAEMDTQSKPRKRMTDLELNKLLNEALAELGLSVKLVTESSYMPNTGVIMMPKNSRQGQQLRQPQEARSEQQNYKKDS
jgi:hypothetical protein